MKGSSWVLIVFFFCATYTVICILVTSQRQLPFGITSIWRLPDDAEHNTFPHRRSVTVINTPRHAYAFLVAGVMPSKPSYRGFIYNILVSTRLLRMGGSTADVVVMIQMSNKVNETVLPEEDAEPLRKSNIKVRYLEKAIDESFYSAVMDKFRVLELTEYSRVLFLDADVMPYCNLDYMFSLSEGPNATLKPNMIMAWKTEPSNGGFFMLQPGKGQMSELRTHVAERDRLGSKLPYPHFDEVKGFGHEIVPPDYWITSKGKVGTTWTFQSAFGGQGLLYHWTKYVKKSVSIFINDEIQNWSALPNGTVYMEHKMVNVLKICELKNVTRFRALYAPQSDFQHFTGKTKPWERIITPDESSQLWFATLLQLKKDLHMTNLDVDKIQFDIPNLGRSQAVAQMHRNKQIMAQDASKRSDSIIAIKQ